jgi:hypothetical protein
MLENSDTPIDLAVSAFAEYGVEAAYFVPSKTNVNKYNIDAHNSFREFLQRSGLHDYSTQPQGLEHREYLPVQLVGRTGLETRAMSLYRPDTKAGDPRFWVERLATFANTGNLIALILDCDRRAHLVNCSDVVLMESRRQEGSPLHTLLTSYQDSDIAAELLGLLKNISSRGFIDSQRFGDTGVGHLLESLLGIKANSNQAPDYKGIEVKSSRPRQGRSQLFAKTPDWDRSPMTAREILATFGKVSPAHGFKRLHCTLKSKPNPDSLFIEFDEKDDLVRARSARNPHEPTEVCRWDHQVLMDRLAKKHAETFWVSALTQPGVDGSEQFHYVRAVHTRAPLLMNFAPMVSENHISVDFLFRGSPSGSPKDHGYSWKVDQAWRRSLFPDPITYDLTKP